MARTENTDGVVTGETPMVFAGTTSIFEGTIDLSPETTRLVVIASQPNEANFGRDEKEIREQ